MFRHVFTMFLERHSHGKQFKKNLKRTCAGQTDILIKQMGENHVSFFQKESIF